MRGPTFPRTSAGFCVAARSKAKRWLNKCRVVKGALWARLAPPGCPKGHAVLCPILRGSCAARSEIRLVCCRDLGILVVIIFADVFGADEFRPFSPGAPIRHERRPRLREDAFVFDRKFELQPAAQIVGIDVHSGVVERQESILLLSPFLRRF